MKPKNIAITGGGGMIGRHLSQMLRQQGHQVRVLGRDKNLRKEGSYYYWDVNNMAIDPGAFDNVDAIVHLAGAGMADKRWTKKRKQEILLSRTQSTEVLFRELKKGGHQVSTFIGASAIGFYGSLETDSWVDETAPMGNGFLAEVARQWEEKVHGLEKLPLRTVIFRIGIVLAKEGGVLYELVKPMKFGLGPILGTGKQIYSWVHIEDLCQMIGMAIEGDSMKGTYNAVAPHPISLRGLMLGIRDATRWPILWFRIPALLLYLALGKKATMVLGGCRVSSKKIEKTGFRFRFTELGEALHDILGKKTDQR